GSTVMDGNTKPRQWRTPPIIELFLFVFYLGTWASLGACALAASQMAGESGWGFLLPVALYALLLLSFVVANWRRYLREGGGWRHDLFWGCDDQLVAQVLFIFADLVLIVWLTALNPVFVSMYFVFYGHTWGMLHWNNRLAFAFMSAALVAQFYQIGVLP